jgi:hypothetical protein
LYSIDKLLHHYKYWSTVVYQCVIAFTTVMYFVLWMYLSIVTYVLHESMGFMSSRFKNDLYEHLKTYKWYYQKHSRKWHRPKTSKRYMIKLRLTTLTTLMIIHTGWARTRQTNMSIPMVMGINLDKYSSEGVLKVNRDNYALSITNHVRIKTDSVPIKVDNCCTQTIT